MKTVPRDLSRSIYSAFDRRTPEQSANVAPPARLETIAALADSLCASLRITARWSPGTIALLIGSKQVVR